MLKKLLHSLIALSLLFGATSFVATPVYADHCPGDDIHISVKINGTNCIENGDDVNNNAIINILKVVLQVASAGVALVVATMIIVAGLQYSAAQGNPQLIQAAKQKLMNAIIGLVMYIFAFALLNYLVPGGILG